MKKTLLLSVVASTMIMAGGDIAPVEPVVEAPAPVASGWDFSGQAVVYYQSHDSNVTDVFDQESSQANAGIQLKAVNSDVFAGVGMGFAVNGLATLNLENFMVSNVMQMPSENGLTGGWVSEAYLTYGMGNTSFKLGRQTLPGALSPLAHSENWNVFENTYDAVLVVNTDIADTVLVGAWVSDNNQNGYANDMSAYGDTNGNNDGVYMITAQNKSIDAVTLTGSWYYGSDHFTTGDDLNALWGDAKFAVAGANVAVQGGTIMGDAVVDGEDTNVFGAEVGYDFGMINAAVAYSTVNDGTVGMLNIGGQQTALYTQMVVNEQAIKKDNDTVVVKAGMEALGGNVAAAYGMTSDNSTAGLDYNEFDLSYTTKALGMDLMAAYVYIDADAVDASTTGTAENLVRFVARYNF